MIRDTTIYVLSRGLPALLTLGSIALLTRYLDPAEFGQYSLAIALAGFLNVVLMSWNLQAYYRFHSIYRGRRESLLNGATAAGFLVSVVIGIVIAAVLLPLVGTWLGWGYTVGVAALFPALAALELVSMRLNLMRSPGRYFGVQVARASGNLIAGGLVAYLTGSVVLVLLAVAAWWLVVGLCAGVARWIFELRSRSRLAPTLRKMVGYGVPLTAAAGLNSAVGTLDRLLLDIMAGSASVGVFAAGSDLVQFSVGAIGSAISLSAYPRIMDMYSKTNPALMRTLRNYLSVQVAVVLPLALGLALVARPLAQLVLGEQLRSGAITVIPWAAAAIFLSVVKGFYLDLSFQLTRWTRGSVIVAAVLMVSLVLLNLLLIPLNGAAGAAQASLGAFLISGIASLALGRAHALAMPLCFTELARIFAAGAVMAIVVHFVQFDSPALNLITKSAAGALTYTAVLLLLNPFELRSIARRSLSRTRRRWRHA